YLLADGLTPLVEHSLGSAELIDGLQFDELEAAERRKIARTGDVRTDRPAPGFLDEQLPRLLGERPVDELLAVLGIGRALHEGNAVRRSRRSVGEIGDLHRRAA